MSDSVGKFKVGQKWRRRDGFDRRIMSIQGRFPICDNLGDTYSVDGKLRQDGLTSGGDLVELIEDVPPAKPKTEKCNRCNHVREIDSVFSDCECGGMYEPETVSPKPASPQFAVGMEGVTTRDGRKVRILCVDAGGDYPIVGLIEDGNERAMHWMASGRYCNSMTTNGMDLMLPGPPKRYVWVDVFKNQSGRLFGYCHPARDSGHLAKSDGFKDSDRVGRIKVELAERFDE